MSDAQLSPGSEQAWSDRLQAEAEQMCPACEQVLWVSFFFDGFGFTDKEGAATNIAKLYQAAYERPDKGARKFYYPGLGAEFDPETAALASALGERALDDTSSHAVGAAKKKARETATETVDDAWERSRGIRDPTRTRRARWTAGEVVDEAREGFGRTQRQARRILRHPGRYAERATRRLRKEWRAYWSDVCRHPWRWAKAAGTEIAKATVGYAAESIGLVRDNQLAAALFNTGVDSRLKTAERQFKAAVRDAQRVSPVHKINVAIFGYDMGGGLALAFSKLLIEELCSGGRHEGIEVKIKFMGLFDCVTNRYDDNLLTGFMPLSNQVSSDLKLLPQVERCVHYAAAHELRFYKPLTMIGANPADYRGPRQELLFPGAQVDVGGGAEDGEDGVSDRLARYPLQMMYNRAYGAGIPMPSLSELESKSPRLYQGFETSSEINDFQRHYRRAVLSLVKVARVITPEMLRHSQPILCSITSPEHRTELQRAQCAIPPEPLVIEELPENIQDELKGHTVVYIQWLRMWYDQYAQTATRMSNRDSQGRWTGLPGTGVPLDSMAYGRYQKLADELDYLENNARSSPDFDMEQVSKRLDGEVAANMFETDPQARALYYIWNNPGERQPEVEALYPGFLHHVHDSMAESAIESAFGDFVMGKHYMNRRTMQRISTQPDRSFLERLKAVYERMFT